MNFMKVSGNEVVNEKSSLVPRSGTASSTRRHAFIITTGVLGIFLGSIVLLSQFSAAPHNVASYLYNEGDGVIFCNNFSGLLSNSTSSSSSCPMRWFHSPDGWNLSATSGREGQGGAWSVDTRNDDAELTIRAPAKKDFWRETYYDPIIVKDDAPFAYVLLDGSRLYTMTVSFTLTAVRQFDQGGLMVRKNKEHWLKAGIEVVDQRPRLSVVVTNQYSDWSTQAYSDYVVKEGSNATTVHCRLRVHLRHDDYVVEGWIENRWEMIRIAHMRNQGSSGKLMAGAFAACPEDQGGASAVFYNFSIETGSSFSHNADGNKS